MLGNSGLSEKEELKNISINRTMVLGKLMGLEADKSPGPDNLHPQVLKEMTLEIVVIFQDSLDSGIVPTDWMSLKVSMQVQQVVKDVIGMLPFIVKGFEYRNRDVFLQFYRA
eukprot:g30072.t1